MNRATTKVYGTDYIIEAAKILTKNCNVIPEYVAPYNDGYLFRAYPKGYTEQQKQQCLLPLYLVDLKTKSAGNIDPIFDIEKILDACNNFKKIRSSSNE